MPKTSKRGWILSDSKVLRDTTLNYCIILLSWSSMRAEKIAFLNPHCSLAALYYILATKPSPVSRPTSQDLQLKSIRRMKKNPQTNRKTPAVHATPNVIRTMCVFVGVPDLLRVYASAWQSAISIIQGLTITKNKDRVCACIFFRNAAGLFFFCKWGGTIADPLLDFCHWKAQAQ